MNIKTNKSVVSSRGGIQKTDGWQVYAMIALPVFFFIVFTVYPQIWTIRYSFYDYDGIKAEFIGLDNFARVVRDKMWWKSVFNTFYLAGLKILIGVPLTFIFALILCGEFKGRDTFRIVNFVPFVLSMSVMAVVFKIMFAGDMGIINSILAKIGLIDKPVEWLGSEKTARATVLITWVWKDFGYLLLLMIAGLQSVSKELQESASVDGANYVQKVWYITIPEIFPVLVIIIMLQISDSLKVFDLIDVLTAGGPNGSTDVMMTYLFNYYFGAEGITPQQGYASAVGVVASVIITVVTLIYLKFSKMGDK